MKDLLRHGPRADGRGAVMVSVRGKRVQAALQSERFNIMLFMYLFMYLRISSAGR